MPCAGLCRTTALQNVVVLDQSLAPNPDQHYEKVGVNPNSREPLAMLTLLVVAMGSFWRAVSAI